MKTATLAALASGAAAQWWGGAPDCAVGPRPCPLHRPLSLSLFSLSPVRLWPEEITDTPDIAILPVLKVGVLDANVGLAGANILLRRRGHQLGRLVPVQRVLRHADSLVLLLVGIV